MHKGIKITLWVLLSLVVFILLLIGGIVFAIRYPSVQTRVTKYFTTELSKRLDTEVKIGSVDIDFFRTIQLNGFLVRDKQRDTLLAANQLRVDIKLLSLWDNTYNIDKVLLKGATVKLIRPSGSEDFNYQFIVDALSSPDTKDSSKLDLKLSLRELRIENVHFRYLDYPGSIDVAVSVPLLDGDIKNFDIAQPLIDFNKLLLLKPDVVVAVLPDDPLTPVDTTIVAEPDTAIVHINTKTLVLLADVFEMRDSRFKYDVVEKATDTTMFDYHHMLVEDIQLIANDAVFAGDTIAAALKHFSLREGCGFTLDTLKGNLHVTTHETTLNDMVLRLPHSRITNAVKFSYPTFASFYDFINDVRMRVELNDATFDLRDIACFAPVLNNFGESISMTGVVRGTVSNLKADNILIESGSNTKVTGNLSLTGLPNINETFIDFNTKQAHTDYYDLKNIYTAVELPSELQRLGTVNFTGNFTGFVHDFVAFGSFNTALGSVRSDLNMKLGDGANASYSGNLSSSGFNVGKLVDNDILGNVAFYARLTGSGLSMKNLDASVISNVQSLDLNGYTYHDIDVNGLIDKKLFTGKLTADDPNIQLDFQGTVDFNEALPRYNFYATIDSARLKPLGFSSKDYVFSTAVSIKLNGDNIDNLTGRAWANDISFGLDDKEFLLDSLTLNITKNNNGKHIVVNSDMASLTLDGVIDIPTLQNALVATVRTYFPSLPLDIETKPYSLQNFDYSLTVNDADPAFSFFYPDVKELDSVVITGNFNSSNSTISLDGKIKTLEWTNYHLNNTSLSANTNNGKLLLATGAQSLWITDSIPIYKPRIDATVEHDAATFNIRAVGRDRSNRVDLAGLVTGGRDSMSLQMSTSNVILQNQRWEVNDSNIVVYGKNYLRVNNLKFYTEDQSISVQTKPSTLGNELQFVFTNLNLGTFYRYVKIGNYDASGIVNGTAKLINPLTDLRFESDVTITNLIFNNDTIHKVTAIAGYDRTTDKVNINVKAKDYKYDFEARGFYSPRDEKNQLDIKVEVLKFRLPILEKYLGEYISSVEGFTGGTLQLSGTVLKPVLTGQLNIPQCNVRVNYLQTDYYFTNETVTFESNFVDLGEMTLFDKDGNTARLGGEIFHENLSRFNLNLYVNTDRFMMLNTGLKDNNLYYGKAYAGGLVTFKGPVDNLEIYANVQSKRGTELSIPIQDEYSVSEHRNVRFISSGQTNALVDTREESSYLLSLNFDLDITPDAAIKIIFDQKAGDIINGRGNGNLRLEINTDGQFNMYGDYTISEGDYLFTLKNFVNKKFIVAEGGTISWSGSPYEAQINMEAIYSVKRANLSDLTGDSLTSSRIPVDVYMNLTGSLLQPAIKFDLILPGTASNFSSVAYREIERIKQDDNELNTQVFGLLVLNRFIPTTASTNSNLVASGVNTSVSEFLFNQLSYWASQNKFNVGININYNSYGNSGSEADQAKRRELIVGLEKSFFDNRLLVEAGGNFGVNSGTTSGNDPQQPSGNNSRVAADITLRYKLTKDGRYTLNAYNKSQYDEILDANRSKRGLSLSYQREFTKLGELFGKRRKSKSTSLQNSESMR